MTPVMAVRMRTVQISTILRVCLAPVLDDLPFVGGISLSLMAQPFIDFDLRHGSFASWLAWAAPCAGCTDPASLASQRS